MLWLGGFGASVVGAVGGVGFGAAAATVGALAAEGVAGHAVDALGGGHEDEVRDGLLAGAAGEAVGVVGVLAGDDGLLGDGLVAACAAVGAAGAQGLVVGGAQLEHGVGERAGLDDAAAAAAGEACAVPVGIAEVDDAGVGDVGLDVVAAPGAYNVLV